MEKALVDTSILIEPFTSWKNNQPNYKDKSMAILKGVLVDFKNRFKPVVSLSILGELSLVLKDKMFLLKDLNERIGQMDQTLESFFETCEKVGLKKETINLCSKILTEVDNRLEPLDALHIATAIVEGCKTFIFIDECLKNNEKIRKFAKEQGIYLTSLNWQINEDKKKPGEFI